jgi:hypothetical protein
MQLKKSTALIIAALLLTTVSTVAGFMVSPGGYMAPLASPPLLGATSGINGSVTIGPVYPVCRVGESPTLAPYYNQVQVVITPSSGLALNIPVNWVLEQGCWVRGTFKVALNPGAYSLTLTSCAQPPPALLVSQPIGYGCSQLPKAIILESGSWTQVDIYLDTGIR